MKKTEGANPKIIISPTDLANHHACSHVTKLELERLSGRITSPPVFEDAFLRMLQDRGRAFEGRVLEQYVADGKSIVTVGNHTIDGVDQGRYTSVDTIEKALESNPDVIYQAKLSMPIQNIDTLEFSGKADFIIKNDEGQYEVSDTKLTQSTKVGSILQVSLYSEMLTQYTGQQPEKLYIHKFGGEVEEYRIDQTMAYYETIKDDIFETIHTYHELAQREAVNIPIIQDIPEPVAHCSVCAYRMKCDDERRAAKHLSLVAGISKNYRERFIAEGHENTDALHALPDDYAPTGQTSEHILKGFRKLIKQNKKQYETEANEAGGSDEIAHEYLPLEPLMGLNALPEPHEDDLFLDFEYDNYVDEMEGLVYLTGWRDMQDNYTGLWAVNAVQEEEQYRTLITKLKEITNWDPTVAYIDASSMTVEENKHEYYVECPITYTGAHIYVYTSAEKTRLQALSEKYGEKDFVDFLIKCQVLVNLHKVIKETMILGLPGYGLKEAERFMKNRTGFTRNMELDTARKHRNLLEVTLNSSILAHRDEEIEELKVKNAQGIEELTKEIVERYNDDDCRSLIVLRDILEEDRIQQNVTDRPQWTSKETNVHYEKPGLTDEQRESKRKKEREMEELIRRYKDSTEVDGLSVEELNIRNLLLNCLQFFKNEDSAEALEFITVKKMDPVDLYKKGNVLTSPLEVMSVEVEEKKVILRFPKQDCDVRTFSTGYEHDKISGKVVSTEYSVNDLHVEMRLEKKDMLSTFESAMNEQDVSLLPKVYLDVDGFIDKESKKDNLRKILTEYADCNFGDTRSLNSNPYIDQILQKKETRLFAEYEVEKSQLSEQATESEKLNFMAKYLNSSVMAVQGPGGTGKTYCIKKLVVETLVAEIIAKNPEAKIGITANNHAILSEIGMKIFEELDNKQLSANIVQKHDGNVEDYLEQKTTHQVVYKRKSNFIPTEKGALPNITIGTTFFFGKKEYKGWFDYIIIEEAGQVTLVDTLLVSSAVKSSETDPCGLILVGDHKQLLSPIKSTKHDGAEISGLEYFADADVLHASKGVFIEKTRRMHPVISSFDSEMFYEGKLSGIDEMEHRAIVSDNMDAKWKGSDIVHVHIEHKESRSTKSVEEVDAIEHILRELFDPKNKYRYQWEHGSKDLEMEDVLIISPFNDQKHLIIDRLKQMEDQALAGKTHNGESVKSLLLSLPKKAQGLEELITKANTEKEKVIRKIEAFTERTRTTTRESAEQELQNVSDQLATLTQKALEVGRLLNKLNDEYKHCLFSRIVPGTVDKYQGREAPICIYTTCSTSVEETPRGPEFTYSRNRFNVAVGRAQALFIMVGNEQILKPRCKRPEHIKLVNPYCHFGRVAKRKIFDSHNGSINDR